MLLLYIDPGTGSLLFSAIIGIGLTVIYSCKNLFYKLLARLRHTSLAMETNFSGKLVFFNEGRQYWHIFAPVIEALETLKTKDFVYISADAQDPGLEREGQESYCYESMAQAIVLLNKLQADTVVMTTPQLGILHLKRAKNVRHYCHLMHSAGALHTYKRFAFDDFDSVLCANKFHIQDLRFLEGLRSSEAKLLLPSGCTEYDEAPAFDAPARDILLAPTWGEKSFFSKYGEAIVEELLAEAHSTDCKLIYRPHPQSWITEKKLLEQICARYQNDEHFVLDRTPSNKESVARSGILICDVSGIIYDFAFLRRRPMLVIRWDWPKGAYEDYNLSSEDSSVLLARQVGKVLDAEQIPQIRSFVQDFNGKPIVEQEFAPHIFHYGKAGPTAAEQILAILQQDREALQSMEQLPEKKDKAL